MFWLFRTIDAIAVVGNGPVPRRYRWVIDRHAFVVRFNLCPSYGNSGFKTDVIVMVPTGPSGALNAGDTVNTNAIKNAHSFWFTKSSELIESEKSLPCAGDADSSIWEDWSERIVERHIRGKPFLFFNPGIYRQTKERLAALSAVEPFEPSSGILALFYLREAFPDKTINLYGFTHEGWRGHPWDAEKKLAAQICGHPWYFNKPQLNPA